MRQSLVLGDNWLCRTEPFSSRLTSSIIFASLTNAPLIAYSVTLTCCRLFRSSWMNSVTVMSPFSCRGHCVALLLRAGAACISVCVATSTFLPAAAAAGCSLEAKRSPVSCLFLALRLLCVFGRPRPGGPRRPASKYRQPLEQTRPCPLELAVSSKHMVAC